MKERTPKQIAHVHPIVPALQACWSAAVTPFIPIGASRLRLGDSHVGDITSPLTKSLYTSFRRLREDTEVADDEHKYLHRERLCEGEACGEVQQRVARITEQQIIFHELFSEAVRLDFPHCMHPNLKIRYRGDWSVVIPENAETESFFDKKHLVRNFLGEVRQTIFAPPVTKTAPTQPLGENEQVIAEVSDGDRTVRCLYDLSVQLRAAREAVIPSGPEQFEAWEDQTPGGEAKRAKAKAACIDRQIALVSRIMFEVLRISVESLPVGVPLELREGWKVVIGVPEAVKAMASMFMRFPFPSGLFGDKDVE